MKKQSFFAIIVFFFLCGAGVFAANKDLGDYKYSLLPISDKHFDESALSQWVRPVVPAILDGNNTVVATSHVRGVALIVSDKEVLVSEGPFVSSSMVEDFAKELDLDSSEFHMGAVLIWNIVPGGESGALSGEIIPYVPLSYLNARESGEVGFMRLARDIAYSRAFPAPSEFPYPVFEGVLQPLQKIIVVGHWRTNKPELIMTFTVGTVRFAREGSALLQVSTSQYDWGAPVFVFNNSGEFLLAGLIKRANLYQKRETEAEMIVWKGGGP